MKRVVIHQPDFVPYLGFFDRLLDADIFIELDDAQFQRHGWQHRDKIKTPRGAAWITVPIDRRGFLQPINTIQLADKRDEWKPKLVNQVRESYRKAPCAEPYLAEIESILTREFDLLVDLNRAFFAFLNDIFDIRVPTVSSSSLGINGMSTERLVELVTAVGGTHYLSGTGALAYLEPQRFQDAGITLEIQDFRHPEYPQLHGAFLPGLSSLDVILNCGGGARDVVRRCRP